MLRYAFAFLLVTPLMMAACSNKSAAEKTQPAPVAGSAIVAADGSCWCDEFCTKFGDCCASAQRCAADARITTAQVLAPIGAPCSSNAACQSNVCRGVCTITCDADNPGVCKELARQANAPHPELAACVDALGAKVCDLPSVTASTARTSGRARRAPLAKQASAAAHVGDRRD